MNTRRGIEKARLFGNRYFCAYCGCPANTTDHTPPLCLLQKPYPKNLMTVPACRKCNDGFSQDETFLMAVLAYVSFEPDLICSKEHGRVADALKRQPKLKAQIEMNMTSDGYFQPTPDVVSRIRRVLVKTVQGLYFKHYGRIIAFRGIRCLAVDHQRNRSANDLLNEFCNPSPSDLWGEGWPEVTPNPMALERAVIAWSQSVDGQPTTIPRFRQPRWVRYQSGVFKYTFRQHANMKRLVWVVDLHKTIAAVLDCPWPSGGGFGGGMRHTQG